METILFAVFLLLPSTTGLTSRGCSGPSDEEEYEHELSCDDELKINIVSAHYGFKYSYKRCSGDCGYKSYSCDCLLDFNATVESNLMNSCNGLQTCNFQTPIPHVKSCLGETTAYKAYGRDLYTYSYIYYVCLPGIGSYACGEPSSGHILSCDADKRIHIMSAHYGFKYSPDPCSSYCGKYYNDFCDCLLDFNVTVASNLTDHCNGMQRCTFQTPKPDIQSCHRIITYWVGTYNESFDRYTYSYILYECLTATTTLPTKSTINTRQEVTSIVTRQIYTDKSTIQSTELDNSKLAKPTESYTPEDRSGRTEEILNTMSMVLHKDTPVDTAAIAGSVVGCILLIILVIIVVVVILKRKTMRTFIDSRFKGSPRVSNPVYEAPSDGYNNVIFKNDNSPSVNVIKLADDYNHLHDAKNNNSMTTGNTCNYLGQMGGDYNHLHDNNNRLPVDDQSGGAYNHLGMVNTKTQNSEELHNANYNHISGSKVDKPDVDYNHLHGDKNDIPKTDYNHLYENRKTEIPNDYNHIGGITNGKTGDVQGEHTQEDVQYEIADDERGDYSNISERQSNYENFPISGHQTCG
ncbi:uncharacterized protein LOC126812498 isoform X2 [Patella vulgata]|nr:uncharacterized protein LOC126812498 isoform X2 [Patella vulgata]